MLPTVYLIYIREKQMTCQLRRVTRGEREGSPAPSQKIEKSARIMKELVDKHGQPKLVIQIKNKLRNLKDFYSTIDNPS